MVALHSPIKRLFLSCWKSPLRYAPKRSKTSFYEKEMRCYLRSGLATLYISAAILS